MAGIGSCCSSGRDERGEVTWEEVEDRLEIEDPERKDREVCRIDSGDVTVGDSGPE